MSPFSKRNSARTSLWTLRPGPERVVREPVGAPAGVVRLVLGKPYLEVLGAAREHPPHRPGLLTVQVGEHRVREVGVRGVAGGHRVAVVTREGAVEALDQLVVRMGHGAGYSGAAMKLSQRAAREQVHRRQGVADQG